MTQPRLITLSASERVMKMQEIILKAMQGRIRWCKARHVRPMNIAPSPQFSSEAYAAVARRRLSS